METRERDGDFYYISRTMISMWSDAIRDEEKLRERKREQTAGFREFVDFYYTCRTMIPI